MTPRTLALARSLPFVFLLLCIVPSTRAGEILVEGRILGPGQRGLAKATVELRRVLSPYENGVRQLGRLIVEPVSVTLSDRDGFFLLTAPEAGMWSIAVRADGFVHMEYPLLPLLAPKVLPPVLLPLTRRAANENLAGSVWVATGRGLSSHGDADRDRTTVSRRGFDRWVVVSREGELLPNVLIRTGSRPVALTDGEGQARVPFPNEGHLHLGFELPEGDTTEGWFQPSGDKSLPMAVHLPPAKSVSGRVMDRTIQKPIAAAFVWLPHRPATVVRTDPEGYFHLPGVDSEFPTLRLAAEGYVPLEMVQVDRLLEPSESTFDLLPAAAVSGIVIDHQGNPVASASIDIWPRPKSDPGDLFRGRPRVADIGTAASGRFHIANLVADETYRLRVRKAGSAPSEISVRPASFDPESRLDVVLGPGQTVFGSLVDALNRGIENAAIVISGVGVDEPSVWTTQSAPDGRFELRHVPAGRFSFAVWKAGFGMVVEEINISDEDRDLESIHLSAGQNLAGQLTTSDGFPVEGAKIQFTTPVMRLLQQANKDLEVYSDRDGRFTIPDLQRTLRFAVSITHPDFRSFQTDVAALSPEPLNIVLHHPLFVTGQVVDREGAPVAQAEIHLTALSQLDRTLVNISDQDGRFAFTHLIPGPALLSASADGYPKSLPLEIDISDSDAPDFLLVLE